jgi:hypothetical protein
VGEAMVRLESLKFIPPSVYGRGFRYQLLISVLMFSIPASAHNAPLGWAYGFDCCSVIDCWQEKEGAIEMTSQGYRVVVTGEIIAYGDMRIRQSGDQFFHRCTATGDPRMKHSICLYVPAMSY